MKEWQSRHGSLKHLGASATFCIAFNLAAGAAAFAFAPLRVRECLGLPSEALATASLADHVTAALFPTIKIQVIFIFFCLVGVALRKISLLPSN